MEEGMFQEFARSVQILESQTLSPNLICGLPEGCRESLTDSVSLARCLGLAEQSGQVTWATDENLDLRVEL